MCTSEDQSQNRGNQGESATWNHHGARTGGRQEGGGQPGGSGPEARGTNEKNGQEGEERRRVPMRRAKEKGLGVGDVTTKGREW